MKNNHEEASSIIATKNSREKIKPNVRLKPEDDKLPKLKSLAKKILGEIDDNGLQVPELRQSFDSLQQTDITGLPDAIKGIAKAYQEGRPDKIFFSFISDIEEFNRCAITLETDSIRSSYKTTGISYFAQRLAASVLYLCACLLAALATEVALAVAIVFFPVLLVGILLAKAGISPLGINTYVGLLSRGLFFEREG